MDSSTGIWLFETASGREIKKLDGHDAWVVALSFTPDGQRLVSASEDQTGLVWDVSFQSVAGKPGNTTAKDLLQAWERLNGGDPRPGYAGVAALMASPAESLKILREKLRHAAMPTEKELNTIFERLGAAEFADREKAQAELEAFGPNAVAAAKTHAKAAEPEVRDRLNRYLSRYDGENPSPYDLRAVRGVLALELRARQKPKSS